MLIGASLALVAVGTLGLALAVSNGVSEPVSQSIVLLQKGNTAERREAAEILARLGDQRAVQPLVTALHDADQLVHQAAEQALWSIWHRSGDTAVDARLQEGIAAMQRGAWQAAVEIFTEIIDMAPGFAEAYNKRATTYYLMHEFEKSIADCEKTIDLNPYHFGALSGAGLCYLGLRDLRHALTYFERAVAVHPHLSQIQQYIKEIKQFFRDQSL
jgi:tetratricopeptide (TPR) repeat protein